MTFCSLFSFSGESVYIQRVAWLFLQHLPSKILSVQQSLNVYLFSILERVFVMLY